MENNNTSRKEQLQKVEEGIYAKFDRKAAQRAGHIAVNAQIGEKVSVPFSREYFDENFSDKSSATDEERSLLVDFVSSLDPDEFFQEDVVNESVESVGEEEQKVVSMMKEFIIGSFRSAFKEYRGLKEQKEEKELTLKVIELFRKERTPATDGLRKTINSLNDDIEALTKKTPESYIGIHGLEFLENVRQIKSGEMVTTPYVEENLRALENRIMRGDPTFIHGHTGGGKTELAINAARNASVDRAALMEALKEYKEFKKTNPDADNEEREAALSKAYSRHRKNFRQALRNGDKDAVKRFSPYMISASKDLITQDMFSDKTLQLSTIFNGKTLAEHREVFEKEFAEWESKNPNTSKEERESARSELFELYRTRVSGFGTEVKEVAKEVLKAIREGRPVIIDEANLIPPGVLASLHNIMDRKPGQICNIPTVGSEMIQPGFAIIMTSNLASGNIGYAGTEEMNQATLNRFKGTNAVINYDYLPMSTTDDYDKQPDPTKNELFRVAIASLADKLGNVSLPEMEKSLTKIFSLCQLARRTQDIFAGREKGEITLDSGRRLTARLNKTVMSMRGLLGILDTWHKGSEMDLDMALWHGFIAGISDSDDQNLILALAQEYNFFAKGDGYALIVKEPGAALTLFGELHPGGEPYFEQSPVETYSIRRVVELLYGPGDEREVYPEDFDLDEIMSETDDKMSPEELDIYESKEKEIRQAISALEVLGEQCGCTVERSGTEV